MCKKNLRLMAIKINNLCVFYVVLIKRALVLSRTLNLEMSRQTAKRNLLIEIYSVSEFLQQERYFNTFSPDAVTC